MESKKQGEKVKKLPDFKKVVLGMKGMKYFSKNGQLFHIFTFDIIS
jgi:hypothetical protein